MMWDLFIYFALVAVICSAVASILAYFNNRKAAVMASALSALLMSSFIVLLWISLGRPPMRTMGETRVWYSFFAIVSGLITYIRWDYKWILSYSTLLAAVFIIINIVKPQIHSQTLVPALQSPWFIPHVTVYMFSYSLLGCAFLIAIVGLFKKDKSGSMLSSADTLVYIGLAFMTFGMLSGAIWAKDAWGHFWSWDPKETWALITWTVYLMYIHLRLYRRGNTMLWYILLIFAFVCLQMCWWGINFLPSAQNSIHVY